MTVAALARVAGFSSDAIRYYERLGLLPPPPRNSAGYRHYGVDAVDRLRFIEGVRRLGLRLREIRDLLRVRDAGTCPCADAAVLLRRHIAEVDTKLAELPKLRAALDWMSGQIPSPDCPGPIPGVWKPPASTPSGVR
jgi:DNA-binding transcriptional MerR regulator